MVLTTAVNLNDLNLKYVSGMFYPTNSGNMKMNRYKLYNFMIELFVRNSSLRNVYEQNIHMDVPITIEENGDVKSGWDDDVPTLFKEFNVSLREIGVENLKLGEEQLFQLVNSSEKNKYIPKDSVVYYENKDGNLKKMIKGEILANELDATKDFVVSPDFKTQNYYSQNLTQKQRKNLRNYEKIKFLTYLKKFGVTENKKRYLSPDFIEFDNAKRIIRIIEFKCSVYPLSVVQEKNYQEKNKK